jgi:hypothetical protein
VALDDNETPVRSVRVPDELWDQVKMIAADNRETVTDVVIRSLKRTVREHPLTGD